MYQTSHSGSTAGTVIFVKNSIEHYEEFKITSTGMQVTTITTNKLKGKLKISDVYCPLGQPANNKMFRQLLQTLEKRFIVGEN